MGDRKKKKKKEQERHRQVKEERDIQSDCETDGEYNKRESCDAGAKTKRKQEEKMAEVRER